MTVIELKAHVDANGEVKLQLPPDFHDIDIVIRVEREEKAESPEIPWEDRPWTDEEIKEMMKPRGPMTGAEIANSPEFGAWAHLGIKDGATWVEEMRREQEERRKWLRD